MLEATERIVVATGILNVWQSEPEQVAKDFSELDREFPGARAPGHRHRSPRGDEPIHNGRFRRWASFLDGLDADPTPVPRDRRCLAALGPKMLELSAERALGSHTYFVPVAHTRAARERLGHAALLAPELACVIDDDVESGRARARAYAKLYLGLRNYTRNLLAFGFTDGDIADGGSDRLIDAVVPQGTADAIAAVAREHLTAGADHVCLQAAGVTGIPRSEWTALAAALGLRR